MRYCITVAAATPPDTNLDELQREGAAALIGDVIDRANKAFDADGRVVIVVDRWFGVHPSGAMIVVVVDAPLPDTAAAATSALVRHLLTVHPPLSAWTVTDTTIEELGNADLPSHPIRYTSRAGDHSKGPPGPADPLDNPSATISKRMGGWSTWPARSPGECGHCCH